MISFKNFITETADEDADTYYHVTKTSNVKSIMKNGLKPRVGKRSKKLNEKPSVFLFKTKDHVEDAMMNWLGDELGDHPATLLKVKVPKHIPVHTSPSSFEHQVFDHIPPKHIENHGDI